MEEIGVSVLKQTESLVGVLVETNCSARFPSVRRLTGYTNVDDLGECLVHNRILSAVLAQRLDTSLF